jgi:uncharacterized protein (AIM24 family)
MMMDNNIQMETIFGDGSEQKSGIFGQLLNAGKRVLTGESLFMTALSIKLIQRKSVFAPHRKNFTLT